MTQNIIVGALVAALLVWASWRAARRARKGSACCGEHEATEKRVAVMDRNRAHYPYELTLNVGGMTCENCARRVENALNGLADTWATVDIGTHTAKVRCKRQPDPEMLRQAVRGAGYVVMDQE